MACNVVACWFWPHFIDEILNAEQYGTSWMESTSHFFMVMTFLMLMQEPNHIVYWRFWNCPFNILVKQSSDKITHCYFKVVLNGHNILWIRTYIVSFYQVIEEQTVTDKSYDKSWNVLWHVNWCEHDRRWT